MKRYGPRVLMASLVILLIAAPVLAQVEKVLVCHAAGREGTPNYVTLEVPATETGFPQGHYTEGGTPLAGHEQDYLGACLPDDTTTTSSTTSSSTSSTTSSTSTSTSTTSTTSTSTTTSTPTTTTDPTTTTTSITSTTPTAAPSTTTTQPDLPNTGVPIVPMFLAGILLISLGVLVWKSA